VARLLVLPLATVVLLLFLAVAGEFRDYQAAGDTTQTVRLTLAVQDLIHELQRERGLSVGLVGGEQRYRQDLTEQRLRADSARSALDRLVFGGQVPGAEAVRGALTGLVNLTVLRGEVDAGIVQRKQVFDFYTGAIAPLNELDLAPGQVNDASLRQGLDALRALGAAKELTGQERAVVNGVAATGRFTAADYQQFLAIRAAKLAALAQFTRYGTGAQRAALDGTLHTPAAGVAAGVEQVAVDGADGRALHIDPPSWWSAITTVIDGLRTVQQAIGADITARAGSLQHTATRDLVVLLVLAALAVAVQLGLAVAAARSVTVPLRALAALAEDAAVRRLPATVAEIQDTDQPPPPPDPVLLPAQASAEMHAVASALSHLHTAAFTLATEQAVVRRNTTAALARLGRRNQDLISRQLRFISALEQQEADPAALGNLFELDHLATRMRRNAESLLILAGEANPRRWSTPLPIADVIRASTAEVEEYRRVALRHIDPGRLSGPVATDVAHILAELVENGLTFSRPDTEVEISGRWSGREYQIAIVDHGAGMSPAELAQANARLAGEENFLLSPTGALGHHVVGRLARNISVHAMLLRSTTSGTVALLTLPAKLVEYANLPATATAPFPEIAAVVTGYVGGTR
jgi:hypothetical protein